MVEIKILKNTIELYKNDSLYKSINLGTEDISKFGFQVVDHIVEELVLDIEGETQIKISDENIEARMITRKLEDKLKIEIAKN